MFYANLSFITLTTVVLVLGLYVPLDLDCLNHIILPLVVYCRIRDYMLFFVWDWLQSINKHIAWYRTNLGYYVAFPQLMLFYQRAQTERKVELEHYIRIYYKLSNPLLWIAIRP